MLTFIVLWIATGATVRWIRGRGSWRRSILSGPVWLILRGLALLARLLDL